MLTLEEILYDVANAPSFHHLCVVDVSSLGKEGETPLHWMATLGDVTAIGILLDNGAAIDAADNNGNTPLHEAVLYRQAAAANALISAGAEVSKKNFAGMTPRDIAEQDGYRPTKNLFVGA